MSIDEFIISDWNDLKLFLNIVLVEINKLLNPSNQYGPSVIEDICEWIDSKNLIEEFYRQNDKWPLWFQCKNEQLFTELIKYHKIYKISLIECNEFDIVECIEKHPDFESFYKYVETYSKQENDNQIIGTTILTDENVRKSIYKLAHSVYIKSKNSNKGLLGKFPILGELSSESSTKVELLNALAGVSLGAGGAVLGTCLLGFFSPVMSTASLVGSVVVSSIALRPYLKEFFAKKDFKDLVIELNSFENIEPDEILYEQSLDKLNLAKDSSNELVKRVRRTYLATFDLEKCNQERIRKLVELEKAFKIIRNYRKKQNLWN